ncbi:MAG: phosphotransferase family protein [Actinomycetota bacterium]|nr:phosphotransferase family protein [Actinomycetota bacterium]MDA3013135.1 phosphotransferase family protein [Actinomycetota bacterium]
MDYFTDSLREFISSNIEIEKEFEYEQFKVGRSNITYKIFDDSNSYVLRRPPFGKILESAHNMQREFNIISELSKTNIPVAKPIFFTNKNVHSDSDFYIMEFIDGVTIADNFVANKFTSEEKVKISNSFIQSLAQLHNFRFQETELKNLGKHENYIERQLSRWSKQLEAQKVRELKDLNLATKMLFENIPTQLRTSIVHGDYRLDNVRISNNSVAAILDWELCTIGDSLADLGTVIASWSNLDEIDTPFINAPTLSSGFIDRNSLLEEYEKNTNSDLRNIEYFIRLSFWKHAMIMEGVYVRYSLGYYGEVNKKEIEEFGNSTLMFAKKASNPNLLKEIL